MLKNVMLGLTVSLVVAATTSAEEINPVLGKVGDFVLREADLERIVGYQSSEALEKLQSDPAQRAQVVRQLLVTRAAAARSRKEGFDRKPEVKEQLGYVIDGFLAEQYLRKVVVADITVPDEEVKKYYAEHQEEFLLPTMVKVRQIFIEVPKDATPAAKEKARERAGDILKQLKEGADFAALAKSSSDDADSAPRGGELGLLTPGKTNSEEFEKAAFALKAGEVSPVVETPFGYHILKVDERTEERTAPYEEAQEYIRTLLKPRFEQQKAQAFLDKLAKEAGVQAMEPVPTEKEESPAPR
ncbi:peptidylprolyl isomerase [Geobacter sp. DSM 9736]|uniref:peptidylprolyl isomerase n=1 Tax=Geobacter sp. DSM 9736 TaxID=1277350 RepID=UPI000B50A157|nr:peptidylprolyl isomerase [Geobacter sp. DSM 9736]SNB45258.1 peptidyl-prolyl cis-trans isomerase C [Geobacter sp. DSM 9736]